MKDAFDSVPIVPIVRAVFLSESRIPAPEYHYIVEGAGIGDLITGPGATGPARVVGYGRKNYTGPVKTGSFWNGKAADTAQTIDSMSNVLKDTFTTESITRQLYGGSSPLLTGDWIDFPSTKGMNMTIEEHETELKRLRKAEKLREKRGRIAKQQAKDRARRRQLAFDTLENIANGSSVRNAQVRMQAARALLRDS